MSIKQLLASYKGNPFPVPSEEKKLSIIRRLQHNHALRELYGDSSPEALAIINKLDDDDDEGNGGDDGHAHIPSFATPSDDGLTP